VTTGAPYFVEIEHHQPADLTDGEKDEMFALVIDALNALMIENGASHTEVLLDSSGVMHIVEVAGRMGGELIGSHMVPLAIGYDYVKAAIEVALNLFKDIEYDLSNGQYSGVYYACPEAGKILAITDNSKKFDDVVYARSIYQIGEIVDPVLDGAGKRAGIIVYANDKDRVNLNPLEVLKYEIEKE
jgi:hypothetical protein